MMFETKKTRLPSPSEALPGRSTPLKISPTHFVTGHRIVAPFPDGMQQLVVGMGCFWGAERKFWQQPGVYLLGQNRPHRSGPDRVLGGGNLG